MRTGQALSDRCRARFDVHFSGIDRLSDRMVLGLGHWYCEKQERVAVSEPPWATFAELTLNGSKVYRCRSASLSLSLSVYRAELR